MEGKDKQEVLNILQDNLKASSATAIDSEQKCEQCSGTLILKFSNYGPSRNCEQYPKCSLKKIYTIFDAGSSEPVLKYPPKKTLALVGASEVFKKGPCGNT